MQSWKNISKRRGKYKQQYVYRCPLCARGVTPYYYAAANAIDWALPAPRIGDRIKPLKAKTMARIAYGLQKFACDPTIMQLSHNGQHAGRIVPADKMTLPTQTTRDDLALILPFIAELHGTSTSRSVAEPLATVCADGLHHGPVTPPFILDHLGEYLSSS